MNIILVTGGTGLVGKGIELALNNTQMNNSNETWVFASSNDVDLKNINNCKEYFEKIKPNYVIHLAAKVGGLFNNMENNLEFFRENMSINDNVLHCCALFNVQKVISCLSTCIFPDKTSYPINETMIHDGPPHDSNYGYSYAKRMITVLNRAYNSKGRYGNGCLFTSVIPTNVYGPYDNFNISDGHVLPGLIHKCYLSKLNNTQLVVWGTGSPLRQFIYSVDLGRLLIWAVRNYQHPDSLILSVDEADEITIKYAAESIARAMNLNIPDQLVFDSTRSDGQYKKTASNAKLRSYLPDFQFTNFNKGIEETCQWFEQNYPNIRK